MATHSMGQPFGILQGFPVNLHNDGSNWPRNSVYSLSAKRYPIVGISLNQNQNQTEVSSTDIVGQLRNLNTWTGEGSLTMSSAGNPEANPLLNSQKCRPSARSSSNNSTYSFQRDDETLRELVKRHGTKKWHIISAKMNKSPLECKQRWDMYLQMCMNKTGWTAEEDCLLLEGHNKFGNRWTEIAKLVPGRTDNAVKNRYNALCKKRLIKENMSKPSNTTSPNASQCIDIERPMKKPKLYSTLMEESREDDCSKAVALNPTSLKHSLSIQIPEENGIFSDGDGSKESLYITNTTKPPARQEQISQLEFAKPSSPRDFQVDMEEVMGWLLAQTPTPSQTVHNELTTSGLATCFDSENFNFDNEINVPSMSSQRLESRDIF